MPFKFLYSEGVPITDYATFALCEDFDVAPTSVKRVTERNDVAEFEYRAVGLPYGNIDMVAGVKHCSCCGNMNLSCH